MHSVYRGEKGECVPHGCCILSIGMTSISPPYLVGSVKGIEVR